MRRGPLAVLALASLAIGLAGCGSSTSSSSKTIRDVTATASSSATAGAKRFSAAGMALHFDFPANFRIIPLAPSKRTAGNISRSSHAAIGLADHDLVVMTRFRGLRIPVTASNLASLKGAFDQPISSAFNQPMSSTPGSVGGLPALSYQPVPVVGLGVPATSRVTLVFSGDDEYELNCQYTAPARAAVSAACDEMLRTLTASK